MKSKNSLWAYASILLCIVSSASAHEAPGRNLSPAQLEKKKQEYIAKTNAFEAAGKAQELIKARDEAKKALNDKNFAAKTLYNLGQAKAKQAPTQNKKAVPTAVKAKAHESKNRKRTRTKCFRAKNISANHVCTNTLTTQGNATVNGNLQVAGNTVLDKNLTVVGNENVLGSVNINQNLNVNGNATFHKDVTVDGQISGGDITSSGKITADRADFNVETTNVSYEDVNVIEDLRTWQTERFYNPDYDRFPDGVLPPTSKLGPGEVYEFTSLSPLEVPQEGDAWSAIVHGIIDFSTATEQEKLDYYSGAIHRLYALIIDNPFSWSEQQFKVGGPITPNSTMMPLDQQLLAAQAMNVILTGLNQIDPNFLTPKETVNLFNLITLAKYYIVAWTHGDTLTSMMGAEYFGSPNPANLESYLYNAGWAMPFINVALIPVLGFSDDGEANLPFARALPGLYKLYPKFLENWLEVAREGMNQGFYPHVLRSRPFTSAGESTFGELAYGYPADIVDLVQSGEFTAFNDSRLSAERDYNDLLPASFEDQLSPDLLFLFRFTIEGLNPLPFLEMLVEQGVMSQTEADYLQNEARITYDDIKASILSFLSTMYLDEESPFVRALRLTRYDDYPGEWGTKFIVNDLGFVEGLVLSGPHSGETVYIDPLAAGPDVAIYDSLGGQLFNVSLQNVELHRDEVYGEEHYINMAELVLNLSRDTPIPYYAKVSNTPGVNPFENWEVQFDNSANPLSQKLHAAGETLLDFFEESINYYLDQWVTETFPPSTTWQQEFATFQEAIDAISAVGRLVGDLEDPANGGVYAFVQHYQPISDEQGPLYDYAQIEAYYDDSWDGVPQLKLTSGGRIDGPPVLDRDGNVLYDPEAPLDANGLINVDALFEASQVDPDKQEYYQFLSATEITGGKSARVYYFFYDYIKHSFEDYLTQGPQALMKYYFSPYINSIFENPSAHEYQNSQYASGNSYNPSDGIITYRHFIQYDDPRHTGVGTRTTILHEFIMGHAIQTPLLQILASIGQQDWAGANIGGSATAEGWAVFIETFFGPLYTSYLSKVDNYFNYIDPTGSIDPVTQVPSILDTSRVAGRLKWDTEVHSSLYKASLSDFTTGFYNDTFQAFPITSEVAQRIPVGPTQGLNYGLGFLQIIGLYQNLPNALGQARYDSLQANGNKATKYFFDLLLLDAQGYFISSLQPIYDEWAIRVRDGIAPFDDPNYDGYPVDAFDAHTNPYTGGDPAAYEYTDNPYVPGGFTFTFPACPVPNTGVCPSP
ncbi:MAG: hypothetical protein LLF94_01535 [Chlamydiales bacterium]|nr:hypothetical protein [Chlamydiales bacterium]